MMRKIFVFILWCILFVLYSNVVHSLSPASLETAGRREGAGMVCKSLDPAPAALPKADACPLLSFGNH